VSRGIVTGKHIFCQSRGLEMVLKITCVVSSGIARRDGIGGLAKAYNTQIAISYI